MQWPGRGMVGLGAKLGPAFAQFRTRHHVSSPHPLRSQPTDVQPLRDSHAQHTASFTTSFHVSQFSRCRRHCCRRCCHHDQRRCSRPLASPGQEANATPSLSSLETLPPGIHEIIGSFVDGKDMGYLSLGNRWCLKAFVEEGVTEVTINSAPDTALMPEEYGAMYLGAFLKRRKRLQTLKVMPGDPCPDLTPLALAFAAGSCRQLKELHWDVDRNMETVASAIAMNALPCLRVLELPGWKRVKPMVMGLATGGSPLLDTLIVIVSKGEEVPGVVAALEQRSLHEACVPLQEFSFHQYIEDDAIINRLFACRMVASVEHFTLGGLGQTVMKAFVVFLEEGLKQGQPRGVKSLYADFYCHAPKGDAELLMDVLARGGAPELEQLLGVWDKERDSVYWSPQPKWLFTNKITGKNGTCPKLDSRVSW